MARAPPVPRIGPKASGRPRGVFAANHPLQDDGAEIGFIQITSIDLNLTVRSGVAMRVLDQGPAHWVGTSDPGGSGNVVIGGHRTTKTKPFYYLNQLRPGDAILLGDGTSFPAIYRVTETLIVTPKDIWITYDSGEPTVTLFACHPRGSARLGSARQRTVVRGRASHRPSHPLATVWRPD